MVNLTFVKLNIFADLGDTHAKPFQHVDQHLGTLFTYEFFYVKGRQNYVDDKN